MVVCGVCNLNVCVGGNCRRNWCCVWCVYRYCVIGMMVLVDVMGIEVVADCCGNGVLCG